MMKAIGGFGGIKLELIVSETEEYSVVFDKRNAYCAQPKISPEGWSGKTVNGKSLQKIEGYRLRFMGLFENVRLGDELQIKTLMKMIGRSQVTGIPMTLYPKWNIQVPDCASFTVICVNEWSLDDLNVRKKIGQRIKELEFETKERVSEPPYFVESEYIHLMATVDGEVILVGDNTGLRLKV